MVVSNYSDQRTKFAAIFWRGMVPIEAKQIIHIFHMFTSCNPSKLPHQGHDDTWEALLYPPALWRSLASLTKTSEGKDVDLSIIEPRVSATITTLKRMEEKDAPFTSRAASVAEN